MQPCSGNWVAIGHTVFVIPGHLVYELNVGTVHAGSLVCRFMYLFTCFEYHVSDLAYIIIRRCVSIFSL